ncbi:LysR substrate-binding domain-containing protein [Gryllotalpicola koreensis]|uniref:LysR substrate-binding domain-containing protein n=1 Tax=Gryllotalpicola koreensis TaxID=993086 RepID=A0ABP7ZRW8_9MICO
MARATTPGQESAAARDLPFTLHQLRLFATVAETGTISGAAGRLRLSQTAVSLALTQLEKALGAELLIRRRAHGVTLTTTGHTVLAAARRILAEATDLFDEIGGRGEVVGGVAVGCYPSLGPSLVPALVDGFLHAYPRAQPTLDEGPQESLEHDLLSGALDVVISYDLALSENLVKVPIAHREPGVLVAADGKWGNARAVDLKQLADEPYVLFDTPVSTFHLASITRAAGFTPRITYRSQNFETVRSLVGRGLGWTVLLTPPRTELTHEGLRVVMKPLTQRADPVDVVIVWPRTRSLSRVARAFVAFAQQSGGGDGAAAE